MSTRSITMWFCLLAACGSPSRPDSPKTGASQPPTGSPGVKTSEPTGPASLTFKVFAATGAGQRSVAPGETLRSGDRLSMEITTDRLTFGYVLQFFPDGSATVLFPKNKEDNRLTGTTRVPRSGWFELDDVVGEEVVYVVASTRPLDQVDASVQAAVEHVRTTNTPPANDATASTGTGSATGSASVGPSGGSATVAGGKVTTKPGGAGAGAVKVKPSGDAPVPGRASLRTRGLVRVEKADMIVQTDAAGLAIFHIAFQHAARE